MKSQKEFYEKYWQKREKDGRFHTKDEMQIPSRINIAANIILKDLNDNIRDSIFVFDIGCGEGTLGKILKEKLNDKVFVIGCDISTIALKNAKCYYDEIYEIDIESNEFLEISKRYKFDYIVALEVLEHLFDPSNVIKNFFKILKEDGYLIASFPNMVWYKYRIDMLKGYFPKNYLFYPGEHIQNFKLYSFYSLLEENHFSPIDLDGQFIYPRIFRPTKLFESIIRKWPSLFGYQLVIKSKKVQK